MKNLLLILFAFALVSCASTSAPKEAEEPAPNNAPAAIKNDSEEWKLARWDEYKPARLQWLTNEKSLANTSRGNWRAVVFTTTDSVILSVMLEKNADRLRQFVDVSFENLVMRTELEPQSLTADEAALLISNRDRVAIEIEYNPPDIMRQYKWVTELFPLVGREYITEILANDPGRKLVPIYTISGEYIGDYLMVERSSQ